MAPSNVDTSRKLTVVPNYIEQAPMQTEEEKDFSHDSHLASRSSESFPVALEKGKDHEETTTNPGIYPGQVVVPRSKRRGLFGQFTLLAEVENPRTYDRKTKWFITSIVAVAGATAPLGSSIFFRE